MIDDVVKCTKSTFVGRRRQYLSQELQKYFLKIINRNVGYKRKKEDKGWKQGKEKIESNGDPQLLFVGNLFEYKKVQIIILAMKKILIDFYN